MRGGWEDTRILAGWLDEVAAEKQDDAFLKFQSITPIRY